LRAVAERLVLVLLMSNVSCAWPSGVSEMSDTVPMRFPDTSTRSPGTIWLAFWKTALTL